MSICFRYVKKAAIYERFIKYVNVHETDAVSLASQLVSNMQKLELDVTLCVGQCYDGAAVMSRRLQGVQVHVCTECKSPCLYVHCHAHRLNLVLVNACNNSPCVIGALGLMEAIYCFVNASTLRHDLFTVLQQQAGLHFLTLHKQSDTLDGFANIKLLLCLSHDFIAYTTCCHIFQQA